MFQGITLTLVWTYCLLKSEVSSCIYYIHVLANKIQPNRDQLLVQTSADSSSPCTALNERQFKPMQRSRRQLNPLCTALDERRLKLKHITDSSSLQRSRRKTAHSIQLPERDRSSGTDIEERHSSKKYMHRSWKKLKSRSIQTAQAYADSSSLYACRQLKLVQVEPFSVKESTVTYQMVSFVEFV